VGVWSEKQKLWTVILIGLFIRIIFALSSIETLLLKFFDDDAFYYFSLAKNMVQGQGIVFNKGVPTNGFHPLYAGILFLIFKLLLPVSATAPLRGALIFLSLCDAVTAYFVYKIVRNISGEPPALFAAFIWSFNPWVIFTSLIGVESALQTAVLSGLIWHFTANRQKLNTKKSFILGFLMGLLFLARMDGVFVCAGIFLVLLKDAVKQKKFRNIIIMSGVAMLTVLPWLVFSVTKAGSLFPVSGPANRLLRLRDRPYLYWVFGSVYATLAYATQFFTFIGVPIPFSAVQIVLIFVLAFLAPLLYTRKKFIKLAKHLNFMFIATSFYVIYYWVIQLAMRRWYAHYFSLLITLTFPVLFFGAFKNRKFIKPVFSVFTVLFLINFTALYGQGNSPVQAMRFEISDFIDKLPSSEKVGSFNTGVLQYFTERDVVNLDGVMNPATFRALKQNQIEDYILNNNIKYLVDSQEDLERIGLDTSKIKLIPVATFSETEPQKSYMTFFDFSNFRLRTFHILEVSNPENE